MPKAPLAPTAEIQILVEGAKIHCKIKGDRDQIINALSDLLLDVNDDPNCFRALIENAMSLGMLKRINDLQKEEKLTQYKKPPKALPN